MFSKKKESIIKTNTTKINTNDYILDDRLYNFTKKIRDIAKDKDKSAILANQITRLIKADKNFKDF